MGIEVERNVLLKDIDKDTDQILIKLKLEQKQSIKNNVLLKDKEMRES